MLSIHRSGLAALATALIALGAMQHAHADDAPATPEPAGPAWPAMPAAMGETLTAHNVHDLVTTPARAAALLEVVRALEIGSDARLAETGDAPKTLLVRATPAKHKALSKLLAFLRVPSDRKVNLQYHAELEWAQLNYSAARTLDAARAKLEDAALALAKLRGSGKTDLHPKVRAAAREVEALRQRLVELQATAGRGRALVTHEKRTREAEAMALANEVALLLQRRRRLQLDLDRLEVELSANPSARQSHPQQSVNRRRAFALRHQLLKIEAALVSTRKEFAAKADPSSALSGFFRPQESASPDPEVEALRSDVQRLRDEMANLRSLLESSAAKTRPGGAEGNPLGK